jgi:hypothetical protein
MTTTEWIASLIPSPFRVREGIEEQDGLEASQDPEVGPPAIATVDAIAEPENEAPEDEGPELEAREDEGPAEIAGPGLDDEVWFEEDTELDPAILKEDWDELEWAMAPRGPALTELLERQAPVVAPSCNPVTAATVVPSIGFEFDLGYGASTVQPPLDPTRPPLDPRGQSQAWKDSVFVLEGENITNHRTATQGFRVEGDGNRIEIATKPFPLTDAGRTELSSVMRSVLDFVDEMARACSAVNPDTSLGFPTSVGSPRHFVMSSLEPRAACLFPVKLVPAKPYYRSGCAVAASPQATFTLPLARIDELVTAIRKSERQRVAGLALSGPRGDRLGDRSDAIYDAQRAVAADLARHLRAGTVVPSVGPVTATTYSKNLQGLLILMVSYLRAGELAYGPGDYEEFAKAYLPINVKNPFRLLFADLSDAEQRTFKALYDQPAPAGGRTALWRLARTGADSTAGATELFPARVQAHQRGWFNPPPTWDDLVGNTVADQRLIRTEAGPQKKGEEVGCEVLYAPYSRLLPYEPGSLRVTVELRRLGFNWVFAHDNKKLGLPGWMTMASRLFKLARQLNT